MKSFFKKISILSSALLILTASSVSFAQKFGDTNSDSSVNSRDIAAVQKHIIANTPFSNETKAIDINCDGKINSRDISLLHKYIIYDMANDLYRVFPFPENNLLQGKTIIVDPGHGVGEGGIYKDYYEHIYNLKYAQLVKESLTACGANVILTRSDEKMVNNYARMAALNKAGLELLCDIYSSDANKVNDIKSLIGIMDSIIQDPKLADTYFLSPYSEANGRSVHPDTKRVFEYLKDDYIQNNILFVSIHTNAPGNPGPLEINGTVTYYMDNEYNEEYYTNYPVDKNARFAQILLNRVSAAGGFKAKERDVNDFFMVRETTIPAALVEVAYHTNESDRAKILDEANRKRVANAITVSVMEYFGTEF